MNAPTRSATGMTDVDARAIKIAKALAADAVEHKGNGHPGAAISLAPAAYLLYQNVMTHDPAVPRWAGRDRFVLSAGHAALLQYIQLYLGGFGLELDDIEHLRTWGSKTPGHPEFGHTDGVEATTGPLGQGLAMGVGMAMSARRERGLFDPNSPAGESPFDHFVYVIVGDGCLQEGVTSEASSLAGTQELGNLIVIWDDNRITIEGHTPISFTEDPVARYASYGWQTLEVDWKGSGEYHEDLDALASAIEAAKADTTRPTFIRLSTIMAWPSPTKQDTGAAHGAKLGADEVRGLKEALGLDPDASFDVPAEIITHTRQLRERGAAAHAQWQTGFDAWRAANPDNAALYDRLTARELPAGWETNLPTWDEGASVSTRAASGDVLSGLADVLPELWGGSADLAGSNNTTMKGEPSFIPTDRSTVDFEGDPYGRTLHFGIREFAMGSILNGIALNQSTRPYGGTFLTFSDYMRPAVRLAALQLINPIFVWTHDSIGLGEDGPTHQPVEHLAALRVIPNLAIVRPADANETAQAWKAALEVADQPVGLVLSRQNLPVFPRDTDGFASAEGVSKGAYVLKDASGPAQVILIGTGSEVQLAVEAQTELEAAGIPTRVVSAPCLEWFEAQDADYRESVLPHSVRARVSVEAGVAASWAKYIGEEGRAISIETYGASADAATLFAKYGFTTAAVVAAAKESLSEVH